ncbi:hypothetical protein C8J56DRAFT_972580, partial [Mycena floridula]
MKVMPQLKDGKWTLTEKWVLREVAKSFVTDEIYQPKKSQYNARLLVAIMWVSRHCNVSSKRDSQLRASVSSDGQTGITLVVFWSSIWGRLTSPSMVILTKSTNLALCAELC